MVIVEQGCEEIFSAVHHLVIFQIKLELQNHNFTISFLAAQACHFFELSRKHGRDIVRCVTSPVNKTSLAFHRSVGFQLEPSTEDSSGIPIHKNYDGPGEDRVLFFKRL
jgi:hypothetical protein